MDPSRQPRPALRQPGARRAGPAGSAGPVQASVAVRPPRPGHADRQRLAPRVRPGAGGCVTLRSRRASFCGLQRSMRLLRSVAAHACPVNHRGCNSADPVRARVRGRADRVVVAVRPRRGATPKGPAEGNRRGIRRPLHATGRTAVVLIHGTFAHASALDAGRLAALSGHSRVDAHVVRFDWSGANSMRSRRLAAEGLRTCIAGLAAARLRANRARGAQPWRQHRPRRRANSRAPRRAWRPIVCLATPFISVWRPRAPRSAGSGAPGHRRARAGAAADGARARPGLPSVLHARRSNRLTRRRYGRRLCCCCCTSPSASSSGGWWRGSSRREARRRCRQPRHGRARSATCGHCAAGRSDAHRHGRRR